jgi:hypothetical protein
MYYLKFGILLSAFLKCLLKRISFTESLGYTYYLINDYVQKFPVL